MEVNIFEVDLNQIYPSVTSILKGIKEHMHSRLSDSTFDVVIQDSKYHQVHIHPTIVSRARIHTLSTTTRARSPNMANKTTRRMLILSVFCIFFALAASDAVEQVKQQSAEIVHQVKNTTSHSYDSIKDKISIGAEEIQNLLKFAAQKEADSQKSRSFTTKVFSILFPSSRPAVNALLATAYISGPPNFLLALCPPNIDPASLSIMVAFAVGGLLGDTFFHLLPEIFLGEDDSASKVRLVMLEPNRNTLLGVFVFIGLATFMAMDKALRIATGTAHVHSHTKDHDLSEKANQIKERVKSHIDKHDYRLENSATLQELARTESAEEAKRRLSNKPYNDTMVGNKKTRDIVAEIAAENQNIRRRHTASISSNASESAYSQVTNTSHLKDSPAKSTINPSMNEKRSNSPTSTTDKDRSDTSDSDSDNAKSSSTKEINPSVKLAGLLNLIADFTHNITDGLALSTSFYSSPALGATTTMAVFFHEIPHEVGDFALLIQSGFSKRSAMGAQFVTAIGAFIGTIIGILVQEYGSGEVDASGSVKGGLLGTSLQWSDMLLPFTAGTFLYVGTVGVIPELLENAEGSTRMSEVKRTFGQFGAMALGALIMVVISWS